MTTIDKNEETEDAVYQAMECFKRFIGNARNEGYWFMQEEEDGTHTFVVSVGPSSKTKLTHNGADKGIIAGALGVKVLPNTIHQAINREFK